MKTNIKYIFGIFFLLLLVATSCTEETYSLGDLTAPSNVVITADIVGKDATHPNGDGSGMVNFKVTADNALGMKLDVDANDDVNWVFLPKGTTSNTYTKTGTFTYRVTAMVNGKGGSSANITKDIVVFFAFQPPAEMVTNLTNDASKTWVVDGSLQNHFGVDDWTNPRATGWWWGAPPFDKAACCNCLYTTGFTFAKAGAVYSLTVTSPDGIFTKTGALAGGLPGIPASGGEGCYAYAGGTSEFSFIPSSSNTAASFPSTKIAIQLSGVNTFIGYGATQKEYEILEITPTYMYLRVRGTETGNSWYLKLKPAP
ncbi:MAG: hypothetical protein PHC28_08325 [Flavobacterium sp.]|uniref:hypothetical protein n=1 Tax=Flavobacterium sp. TaxID=239 RepID=UPI00262C00FE|nr:hypothetical protein [Flavobacterium sp.]MDD5150477.1 hypothetical protein [Flavobacterium sp.]